MIKDQDKAIQAIGAKLKQNIRHGISYLDLTGEAVDAQGAPTANPSTGKGILDYAAKAFNIPRKSIDLPTPLAWSISASMDMLERNPTQPLADGKVGWGTTTMYEWLNGLRYWKSGAVRGVTRLVAGSSDLGGLREFNDDNPGHRIGSIAFRLAGSASR